MRDRKTAKQKREWKVWVTYALRTNQVLEVEERRCDVSNPLVWKKLAGPVDISPATLTLDPPKKKARHP